MAKIKYFNGREFMEIDVDEEVAKAYKLISEEEIKMANRNRKRQKLLSLELALELNPNAFICDDLIEQLNAEEENQKVRNAINILQEKHREIIIKYYFENVSITELAEQYGVKKSTMSEQIDRILEKLKKILQKNTNF